MTHEKTTYVLRILFLVIFGYVASDIYVPSLPAITLDLHTTEKMVQLTMFTYMLSFSIAPLIAGPLSDSYGRRPVILTGLLIAIAASVGAALSETITGLIIGRFFQGLGAAFLVTSARAIIPDVFKAEERAYYITIMTLIIPIFIALAPLLGGYLQEHSGWRTVFWFMVAYSVLSIFLYLPLGETISEKRPGQIGTFIKAYKDLFTNPSFMLLVTLLPLLTIPLVGFYTATPFLFQDILGLSPSQNGQLYAIAGGMIFVGSVLNMSIIGRVKPETIITAGTLAFLVASVGMLIWYGMAGMSVMQLMVPTCVGFFCIPICMSNSFALAFGKLKSNFGAATAINTTWQFAGATLASLIFSLFKETNPVPLAVTFIICAILMLVCIQLAKRY